jgi:hypothetical protein
MYYKRAPLEHRRRMNAISRHEIIIEAEEWLIPLNNTVNYWFNSTQETF